MSSRTTERGGIVTCPFCGKKYLVVLHEQIPGFRFPEEEICPYCEEMIRTSLDWDFEIYKIDNE